MSWNLQVRRRLLSPSAPRFRGGHRLDVNDSRTERSRRAAADEVCCHAGVTLRWSWRANAAPCGPPCKKHDKVSKESSEPTVWSQGVYRQATYDRVWLKLLIGFMRKRSCELHPVIKTDSRFVVHTSCLKDSWRRTTKPWTPTIIPEA